jgi:hypothetical protein
MWLAGYWIGEAYEALAPGLEQAHARSMRSPRIDRLFHSIVVLGAALGAGCSSNVETIGGQSASGSGGAGGAGGEGGAAGSTGEGGAGGSGGQGGGGPVIDDASDCPSASQFQCDYVDDKLVCLCDPNAPAGPEACEQTADFHCWQYEPEYVTCECVPGSPAKAEDCGDDYWYCSYYEPPVGCQCVTPIA